MEIRYDGSWWYMGTPIGRPSMITLFSRVLKKEEEDYFLVTPVEKVKIKVADTPFVITQWQQDQHQLYLTTQQQDRILVSPAHPVEIWRDKVTHEKRPYVLVRRNLWGRLHQNVYYQLINLGYEAQRDSAAHLCLNSGDYQFSLGKLENN
jgi:hypothetical protein